jgi:hypothetical protein
VHLTFLGNAVFIYQCEFQHLQNVLFTCILYSGSGK